jgi:putative acetyltransferase
VSDFRISVDGVRPDVLELARTHRVWAGEHSPAEDVHAVEAEALAHPTMTLLTARTAEQELLGMGALRDLDGEHAEVKAMHVCATARRTGVGMALITQLVELARERGYQRLSLETGTMEAFASARRLYEGAGFTPCPPFGDYTSSPNSIFLTLPL